MKSSIPKERAGNLIPVLSEMDKQEMVAYYTVYEKYADVFSEKATEDLKDHPVFGKLIRDIPKEVSVARDKLSRELQKDAILNDNWVPYIEYQIEQGIAYAKMGLNFKSWYEVIVLVKNYIRPLLHKEYVNGTELLSSLNGMNRFMDIAMGIIGEAYLQEKQETILEDREKIKKLNEELERKVIERTAQLESNIQKLNEYKHFFYNSNDFSCIANVEGYFEILNPNFEKLLGYSEKELLENQFLNFIHPDDIAATLLEIEKLKTGALTINFVNRYRKKDGSYLWFDWNTTPDPVTGKLYAIAREITERKKAEEQLQAVNKELEAFSYSVSHDLRAPLRAINGFSKILHDDYASKMDADGISSLNAILNNSKKMGILIDDLLEFSRLGRKEITTSVINMTALAILIKEEALAGNTNEIEFVIHDLLPAKGDQALIRQVWVNLISNAIKYSKNKPKIKIEIGSYYKDNLVVYYVKDNGAGFEMQYYNKLFGVFHRLHSSEEFEGTGVGLAIVQKIINRHNGTVWAESKLNEETSFYFTLPDINA